MCYFVTLVFPLLALFAGFLACNNVPPEYPAQPDYLEIAFSTYSKEYLDINEINKEKKIDSDVIKSEELYGLLKKYEAEKIYLSLVEIDESSGKNMYTYVVYFPHAYDEQAMQIMTEMTEIPFIIRAGFYSF